jgi:hypothetical protein
MWKIWCLFVEARCWAMTIVCWGFDGPAWMVRSHGMGALCFEFVALNLNPQNNSITVINSYHSVLQCR